MAGADHRILNNLITTVGIVNLPSGRILNHHLRAHIADYLGGHHLLDELLALIRAVIRQELLVQLLHLAGNIHLPILQIVDFLLLLGVLSKAVWLVMGQELRILECHSLS